VFDEGDKEWVIDGVCWNDGSGTDSQCNGFSDPMIAAGVWPKDDYVNTAGYTVMSLVQSGNNDEG
jgi:hypothetical protein